MYCPPLRIIEIIESAKKTHINNVLIQIVKQIVEYKSKKKCCGFSASIFTSIYIMKSGQFWKSQSRGSFGIQMTF